MSSPSNDGPVNGPPGASPLSGQASTPVPSETAPADQDRERAPEPVDEANLRAWVVEVLSNVYDPEIPVSIYELGLIYDITIGPDAIVGIRMTLTAPNCPAAFVLPLEVERRVRGIPGVKGARVEVVWDPPWDKDRMSEAAKLQLGLL